MSLEKLDAIEKIEGRIAKRGLKMAINDMIEEHRRDSPIRIAEIDAALGCEVEGHLAPVELSVDVTEFQGQVALDDLFIHASETRALVADCAADARSTLPQNAILSQWRG